MYSEWFDHHVKPDLNGVYQRRNPDKPNTTITYSLYRRGWHVDCATPDEAARAVEKENYSALVGKLITFRIGGDKIPTIQWRGLAKMPIGIKVETSDKYGNF
jgi:hypothetical protein